MDPQPDDPSAIHILVVDDDADIRETLPEILEDEGYSVGTAANGRDALAYLRQVPKLLETIHLVKRGSSASQG